MLKSPYTCHKKAGIIKTPSPRLVKNAPINECNGKIVVNSHPCMDIHENIQIDLKLCV